MRNRNALRWLALVALVLAGWLMAQLWRPAADAAPTAASDNRSAAGTKKHPHNGVALACATCHAAQALEQPGTPMGSTLEMPDSNPVLLRHPHLTTRRGAYTYTVDTVSGATTYSVTDGQRTIALPVVWSVGAQAQTWLVEFDGRLYETMVSYYPSIDGLDVTTADDVLHPTTLEAAIGRPETDAQKKSCFGCHTTNAIVNNELTLNTMQPGVTCEHCHTGTLEHMTAIQQGKSAGSAQAATPPSLGKFNAEQMSTFCGQCHRTWEMVTRGGTRGTPNVRFQAYRLANSRCFDGTDTRISCVACHDPHRNLTSNQANPAFYDAKCLACHGAGARNVASLEKELPKPCPVAKTGCVTCHMPRTKVLNGPSEFTDHEIRVVRAGDPYPN
jgi:hypothetical protein